MEIRRGIGDWEFFDLPMEMVYQAATEWKSALKGVEKPWLCWHVSEPWTRLQVNLVKQIGWTPIVGYDPDCGDTKKPEFNDCITINFNEQFGFQKMYMHFPLEFAFLWTERLAFWHSDLLVRIPLMAKTAGVFETLPDGIVAACPQYGRGLRDRLFPTTYRMWELIGMTTAGASEDQFAKGAGWWKHFWFHPNCPDEKERKKRSAHYYDHGTGVMYWHRRYGGKVQNLNERDFREGHCTSIGNKSYVEIKRIAGRKMIAKQLEINFKIEEVAERMGLTELL
jgi:hypothetical protein